MSTAGLPWFPRLMSRLMVSDVITCGYLTAIGLLATVFAERLPQWWWYPLAHGLCILALLLFLLKLPAKPPQWVLFIRWWYPAFLIPPIFSELQFLVHPMNPVDLDLSLISIDLALFGVHPTVWLERLTVPWLTEYMQLAYMTFYFLPFILCAPWYRQGDFQAFRTALCALLLGYYVSYLMYFLTPARGPRFYLAAYQSVPLHGLWLATPLQELLDHLEGVQRDAFPSGHTAIALMVMVMAWHYQHRLRYPLLGVTTSLICSTVYLRYHYVIDVIAGIVLALWCLSVAFWLHREPQGSPATVCVSAESAE